MNNNEQDQESELPNKLEFEVMDTSGMWFAAAAVFAVLAACTIIYRVANDDFHVASSDTASTPAANLR